MFFRIEKKRAIIPTLAEGLKGNKSGEINVDYFYKLLFTRENLKLVHIVCHKKPMSSAVTPEKSTNGSGL